MAREVRRIIEQRVIDEKIVTVFREARRRIRKSRPKTQEAIAQWTASMKGFKEQPASETDPDEVSSVSSKLDAARVKLAQEKKR